MSASRSAQLTGHMYTLPCVVSFIDIVYSLYLPPWFMNDEQAVFTLDYPAAVSSPISFSLFSIRQDMLGYISERDLIPTSAIAFLTSWMCTSFRWKIPAASAASTLV